MALVKTEDLVAQVQGFAALPVVKQVGLMVALAATIALAVAVVLWSREPNYSLLFANLGSEDLASIATTLDDQEIPYRVEQGSGSIYVPSDKVHHLRLELAGRGLPEGQPDGFELLDKKPAFGTSRFMERARYQHVLEGELARTIDSLASVESSRVHLAIPKESVFLRERAHPTASVLVHLRPGGTLSRTQVAGIVHLLASSVPGLEPDAVTVVDQRGRLLSDQGEEREETLDASQFEYNRKLEQEYSQRIVDILSPIVGEEGVRAKVAADLDFTVTEETRESYRPDKNAIRSEKIKERQSADGAPGGVPGSLTNEPPRGGTLNSNQQASSKVTDLSKEVVRNYELDHSISHSKYAPGKIRRLSVAVVLDYKKQLDKDGKVKEVPLDQKELDRVTELVKKAVGFDASRNDSINVINIPFHGQNGDSGMVTLPWWRQPWVWEMAKPVAGAIFVLLLALGVLRPTLKNLAETGRIIESEANAQRLPPGAAAAVAGLPMPEGEGEGEGEGEEEEGGQIMESTTEALEEERDSGAESEPTDPDIERARSLVHQDPRRVAQVIRNWVTADE